MRKYTITFLVFTLFIPFFLFPIQANAHTNKVAIVIDDFGNNMKGTDKMLSLPIPLTVAVMPFLPSTKQDAIAAHKKGHEVIIHMPMEPIRGKKEWLGPKAITTDLSDEEINNRLEQAIQEIPHAIGMNNHMGSKVTADERIVRLILSACKKHGLFYLDSKTNPNSVVPKIGKELGVPIIENQLFFDDVYTVNHISKQAQLLIKKIQDKPIMVAIGHVGAPGEITSRVIETSIPKIREHADFIFLSDLALSPPSVSK
ncbi:TPA: divergent polysaccharide deacetylase family protein [Bacillus cereus]|uniref:divergent polysaccharide deacetylase family protein n=1 Tax=Bacillus TaxID=1386 RepID=UPI001C011FA3|nr:divergent polysaccharide deacetylase family protein [Bacillus mycoides]QWG27276.1 divergent polysaccharide deacetylase family protein [Bacillus mycoides]HDR3887969.1 divergent polysaccharide deacetylase family protein [Bacillus cereus]HDR7610189.1 divergent polysaccharide deacetylase family protein [Bacillus mycoides]